ncbi:MAG: efflux RND transporter periplasmic adaptor subunit [Bacteroidales bacterium]|jgi:multidrug efflux system membrane fusion protein|nr:efflux RND transporter periplasmic adaptor subunit [Bacteroidales bacterium]
MKHLIYFIGIVISTSIIFSCANKEKSEQESIRPVFYERVEKSIVFIDKTYPGVAQSQQVSNLSFKVGGTIKRINVELGQEVNKGKVLASLVKDDYNIKLQQAQSFVSSAETQYNTAKSSYERIEKLYKNSGVSLNDFEKAKAQFEASQAQYETAKSQLQAAKNQVSYTDLKAPFNGKVSGVLLEANEFAPPGRPAILISSQGNIEIKVPMPGSVVQKVQVGDKVKVSFKTSNNEIFEGLISEISFGISNQPTYPVIITISKSGNRIRPGMVVQVQFLQKESFETNEYKAFVSVKAVGEINEKNFVYVLENEKDGIYEAHKKVIETGEIMNGYFPVINGLIPGDIVVTAGLEFMYDGRKVKLLEQK